MKHCNNAANARLNVQIITDFILSIVKVLIAKHLDASDTLNYALLLKEKIMRLYTALTSDYQLHI
jgi:hypothetical protein